MDAINRNLTAHQENEKDNRGPEKLFTEWNLKDKKVVMLDKSKSSEGRYEGYQERHQQEDGHFVYRLPVKNESGHESLVGFLRRLNG